MADDKFLRPLRQGESRDNGDGTHSTEILMSEELGGKPANFPSLWYDEASGKTVQFEDPFWAAFAAAEHEKRTGEQFPRYENYDDAVAAAKARSERGGLALGPLEGSQDRVYQRGSVLPVARMADGTKEWGHMPELALSMYESFKAPSEALAGELTQEELQQRGMQFGMDWMGGGLAGKTGKAVATGTLPRADAIEMLLGPGAKQAPARDLANAEAFAKNGVSPDTIWKATGVDVGFPDAQRPIYDNVGNIIGQTRAFPGKFRWEVSDAEIAKNIKLPGHGTSQLTVEEVLGPDNFLRKNYPQDAELLRYRFDDTLSDMEYGYFNPREREIVINPNIDPEDQIDTVLHETQHAVQYADGNIVGDSPSNYANQQPYNVLIKTQNVIVEGENLVDLNDDGWNLLRHELDFRKAAIEEAAKRGITGLDPFTLPVSTYSLNRIPQRDLPGFEQAINSFMKIRANMPDLQPDKAQFDTLYGTAVEVFRKASPHGQYQRNLGEVQARMTGFRRHLSEAERRSLRPSSDEFLRYSDDMPGKDKRIPMKDVMSDAYGGQDAYDQNVKDVLTLDDYKDFR